VLRTLTALVVLALAHGPPAADPVVHWRHSTSLGRPDHGSLVNGVQLPAEGITFFTWDPVLLRSPDRGWRRWGNDRLVRMVQEVVGEYWLENPDAPRVCIGDLSRRHGGDFQPTHASHQNGLDVDVYFPRIDRVLRAPTTAGEIDHRLAQDLLDRFVAAGAQMIFVGYSTGLHGPAGVVIPYPGHEYHMHVRFPPPGA
jgi:murein endopeptidase